MATTIPTKLKTSDIIEKWAGEIKTAYIWARFGTVDKLHFPHGCVHDT